MVFQSYALDPSMTAPESIRAPLGTKLILGLRPEAFSVTTGAGVSTVSVNVNFIEPTGPEEIILFDLAGHEVVARVGTGAVAQIGALDLAVDMQKAVFFDPETELRVQ
jgi:multiple sugar transport system ATP-binding protein